METETDFVKTGGKGNPMYQRFEDTCCQAYNIVRKNADLFINLFSLVTFFSFIPSVLTLSMQMLSTGLTELQSVDNIMFLRDQLMLDLSDELAKTHFKSLID